MRLKTYNRSEKVIVQTNRNSYFKPMKSWTKPSKRWYKALNKIESTKKKLKWRFKTIKDSLINLKKTKNRKSLKSFKNNIKLKSQKLIYFKINYIKRMRLLNRKKRKSKIYNWKFKIWTNRWILNYQSCNR
jgi:hypothetical protein